MSETELRKSVATALARFGGQSLLDAATDLFGTLGYQSDRRFDVDPRGGRELLEALALGTKIDAERALLDQWRAAEIIFQITRDEVAAGGQLMLFDTRQVDQTRIESYLLLAVDLTGETYTRTALATITREINRYLPMPVLILFRHGGTLTFAVIDRRLHKRDDSRDVMEKVTLIKDIAFSQPHRAHVDILADLALPRLAREEHVTNFVELHHAWRTVLDSTELNRRFYREVANWYFWAVEQVEFPSGAISDRSVRNATSLIRLITRLIFVWFLKEKGLVPEDLFSRARLRTILTSLDKNESTYYKAILQNLFFATLNQEMNTTRRLDSRKFRGEGRQHYNITNLYRHRSLFPDPDAALQLFADIPFLNGGLFECLDKPDESGNVVRVDGFSDRNDVSLHVPNDLFFATEHDEDLNAIYGTKGKNYKVRGLITILQSYKFTVAENTPIEEEVALDPELLGQVFENLLAAYNPETETTARKQTGSFYTPRNIVNYMVDEALVGYLEHQIIQATRLSLPMSAAELATLNERLRELMTYSETAHRFSADEVRHLIIAIDGLQILDPACGSGAFPMGVLQKLVHILGRLDPRNERWKAVQIKRVRDTMRVAEHIDDADVRDRTIAELEGQIAAIEEAFDRNELDYGRKLYLIENCIYGVDIQPIAVQIAKLRCFIALIVDQRIDDTRENRGIRPLPNLETKFVAANALVRISRPEQLRLSDPEIDRVEERLHDTRSRHFNARTPATKTKYREIDKALRTELAALLRRDGFAGYTAMMLAAWDPYDQNASAPFFDSEWMFGIKDGFDIMIANPPYVRQEQISELKPYFKETYPETYSGTADLFVYFFHQGIKLLRSNGLLVYIASNSWLRANYATPLRSFLRTQVTVEQIMDLGDNRVFADVPDVYPAIPIVRKVKPSSIHIARTAVFNRGEGIADLRNQVVAKISPVSIHDQDDSGWQLDTDAARRVFVKIMSYGRPLGESVKRKMYYGIKTGLNEAFIIDSKKRADILRRDPSCEFLIKEIFRGEDLRPWYQENEGRFLICIPFGWTRNNCGRDVNEQAAWEIISARYPSIADHLASFEINARKRQDKGDFWWELRSCDYYDAFDEKKIFWADIGKFPRFSWDDTGAYVNDKGFIMVSGSTHILGLIQSRALWLCISQLCVPLGERAGVMRYQQKSQFISRLPIPEVPAPERKAISDLAVTISAEAKARYALHHEIRTGIADGLGSPDIKLNQKLTAWWDLDFLAFRNEVRKVFKREIGPKEREKWEAWLQDQQQRHAQHTAAIVAGETELNARVYALFNLNADEIKLIEESTKYKYGEV